jgi:hypothetical protein
MFPWRSLITIFAFAFLFAFVTSEFRREQQSHLSRRTQRAAEQREIKRELTKSFAARSPARKIGLESARVLTKRDVCTDAFNGERVTQTCSPSQTLCCKSTWDVILSIKLLTLSRHYSSRRPTPVYDNPRIWLLLHRVCSFSTMRFSPRPISRQPTDPQSDTPTVSSTSTQPAAPPVPAPAPTDSAAHPKQPASRTLNTATHPSSDAT